MKCESNASTIELKLNKSFEIARMHASAYNESFMHK